MFPQHHKISIDPLLMLITAEFSYKKNLNDWLETSSTLLSARFSSNDYFCRVEKQEAVLAVEAVVMLWFLDEMVVELKNLLIVWGPTCIWSLLFPPEMFLFLWRAEEKWSQETFKWGKMIGSKVREATVWKKSERRSRSRKEESHVRWE